MNRKILPIQSKNSLALHTDFINIYSIASFVPSNERSFHSFLLKKNLVREDKFKADFVLYRRSLDMSSYTDT